MQRVNVLVVEDDARLAQLLVRSLTEEGYVAEWEANGAAAVERAANGSFDLVILDWMLPGKDGLAVCRELRARGATAPILMLTARAEPQDRVLGLDEGADHYMVKPFDLDELLARVRALMRRAGDAVRIRRGDIELDRFNQHAFLCGNALSLTSREFALLVHLALHAGRVVPRNEILSEVWGLSFDPGTNLVDVHVSRLRDKLGSHAWMIETIRGVGYRLNQRQ